MHHPRHPRQVHIKRHPQTRMDQTLLSLDQRHLKQKECRLLLRQFRQKEPKGVLVLSLEPNPIEIIKLTPTIKLRVAIYVVLQHFIVKPERAVIQFPDKISSAPDIESD